VAWNKNQPRNSMVIVVVCFLGLAVGSGCGTPCGNLWQKLERCAKSDSSQNVNKSKDMRQAFRVHCKKSNKSRIKSCIKLKSCDAIRRCATKLQNKYKH
jgi:hypothetical protein